MRIVMPAYCAAPIWWYRQVFLHDKIVLSKSHVYERQTFFNRLIIPAPNNIQKLTVPVVKRGKGLPIEKVKISYDTPWQKQHWKSLKTAYGNSAYWEYYNYILKPIYFKKHTYLINFNIEMLETILTFFEIDIKVELVDAPISEIEYSRSINQYHQMFVNKYGFCKEASILDLLFNMGKEGISIISSKKI